MNEARELCKQTVSVYLVDDSQYTPEGGSTLAIVMQNRWKLKTLFEDKDWPAPLRAARVYLVDDEGMFIVPQGEWHYTMTSTAQLDPHMFTSFFTSFGWPVEVSGCRWNNN